MGNTITSVDFETAQKLENNLISKLHEIKRWGDNHSADNLYEKISLISKDMRFLLWEHQLIESYQYSELSWESKYRVNCLVEIIIEFFETDEEKNTTEKR